MHTRTEEAQIWSRSTRDSRHTYRDLSTCLDRVPGRLDPSVEKTFARGRGSVSLAWVLRRQEDHPL